MIDHRFECHALLIWEGCAFVTVWVRRYDSWLLCIQGQNSVADLSVGRGVWQVKSVASWIWDRRLLDCMS